MGRALSIEERTRKTCYFSRQGPLISRNLPALAVGSMSKISNCFLKEFPEGGYIKMEMSYFVDVVMGYIAILIFVLLGTATLAIFFYCWLDDILANVDLLSGKQAGHIKKTEGR